MDRYETIDRLHGERDLTAVKSIYDDWASSYDDNLGELGYRGPQMGAAVLHDHLPDANALILDAGCGTGLVGHWLHGYGYRRLHGADYSEAMLGRAAERGIYERLFQADFQVGLGVETAVYDALICIGVMGSHVPATVLDEFARVVKPSGLLCISARVAWYEQFGAKQQIERMVAARTVERVAIVQKPYMDGQTADALYCVLRVQ